MPTQDEINKQEYDDPSNWHFSLYASRKDSRTVVPKRTGLRGVTVNFSKPLGIGIHIMNIAIGTTIVVWAYCTFFGRP
jgi:uncharacterized membrane protein